MKRVIILSLLVATTFATMAHTIVPKCWSNQRFELQCSDMETAGNPFIRVKINTAGVTWANGSQDTVFASQAAFTLFVPQPNVNSVVSVTIYNQKHDQHGASQCTHIGEQHTLSTTLCNALPVKFKYVNVKISNK